MGKIVRKSVFGGDVVVITSSPTATDLDSLPGWVAIETVVDEVDQCLRKVRHELCTRSYAVTVKVSVVRFLRRKLHPF